MKTAIYKGFSTSALIILALASFAFGQTPEVEKAQAQVNKVLEDLIQRNAPPQKPGEEVKLLYASQIGTRPPAFAVVCNRPADVPEAYQRYLLNGFRAAWGFDGAPVRLKFKRRASRGRT